MPDEKFKRTNEVRKALAHRPVPARQPLPPPKPKVKPDPKAIKKVNPRSAKARDARALARGRLPIGTAWTTRWDGQVVTGVLCLFTVPPGIEAYGGDIVNDFEMDEATKPKLVKAFNTQGDGVFRVMEELDVMFWNWFAAAGDEAAKARLVFSPNPPAPAPMPAPGSEESTDSGG